MSVPTPRNPYAAPRTRNLADAGMRTPMYTPTQIALGTFVGGVVAFVYFLRANFLALGNSEAAHKTLLGGAVLFAALVGLALALPRGGGSVGIALIIAGLARWIAERHQMTKDAIAASSDHDFHSSWRVAGIALACLAISFALVFGAIMAFALLTAR